MARKQVANHRMANLSYIDTKKSIETGRLSIDRSGFDKTDLLINNIVWSTLCLAIIFYPVLAYFHIDINSSNDRAVAFVLFPLLILFGLYGLYRKLTENKLMSVDTSLPKQKAKEHLLAFLKQKGFENFRESNEVIIVNVEESLSFNNLWTKTITFIIADERIYFTVIKNFPKINPPVFFSHWSLKADLKEYFIDK